MGQPAPPAYPVDFYAAPPPAYAYSPYGYPAPPKTNGLAVAALVVSILSAVGLCAYGVGGILGIAGALLGHFGRRQIRERGEAGDGLALAGIIIGWIAFGLAAAALVAIVIFFAWAIGAG